MTRHPMPTSVSTKAAASSSEWASELRRAGDSRSNRRCRSRSVASATVSWSVSTLSVSSGDRSRIRGASIASRRSTAANACMSCRGRPRRSASARPPGPARAGASRVARCSARSRRSCSIASRSRMSRGCRHRERLPGAGCRGRRTVDVATGMSGSPSSGCTGGLALPRPALEQHGPALSECVVVPPRAPICEHGERRRRPRPRVRRRACVGPGWVEVEHVPRRVGHADEVTRGLDQGAETAGRPRRPRRARGRPPRGRPTTVRSPRQMTTTKGAEGSRNKEIGTASRHR